MNQARKIHPSNKIIMTNIKYSGTDIGLLLIRISLAAVFLASGLDNILSSIYFIGIIELLAGIAMAGGIFTGWAAVIMAADMIGAVTFSKVAHGFGGYDLELIVFLSALAIAFAGGGKYSLDGLWKKD